MVVFYNEVLLYFLILLIPHLVCLYLNQSKSPLTYNERCDSLPTHPSDTSSRTYVVVGTFYVPVNITRYKNNIFDVANTFFLICLLLLKIYLTNMEWALRIGLKKSRVTLQVWDEVTQGRFEESARRNPISI